MHFNTKYIFQGDSKKEIDKKINYNFDQILSFAVGPNGHIGAKGPTGFPGPAGKRGLSGGAGARASLWFNQLTQPSASISLQGDLWVDESTPASDVKILGPTGTWTNTGYSLFSSDYFKSYSGISGPAGVTDKFAIAFNNSGILNPYNELDTSLVISDKTLNSTNSNPNRSKLLISTEDQILNPVFSFIKSTSVTSSVPSFYWKSTGSSVALRFNSSAPLTINSLLGLSVNTSSARTLLTGNLMSITAGSGISIKHTSDFYFNSNTTIGTGSYFSLTTNNIVVNPSYYWAKEPTKIISGESNTITFNTSKTLSNPGAPFSYGLNVNVTEGVNNPFEFIDSNGAQIFSSRPKGAFGSGSYLQTIFGSTGGFTTGGTAGPYLYNVRGLKEIRISSAPQLTSCYQYGTVGIGRGNTLLSNVINLSNQLSFWDSNFIMVTPAWPGVGTTGSFYLYVPTTTAPVSPLYYTNQDPNFFDDQFAAGSPTRSGATHYRIFANDLSSNKATAQIKIIGLVWDYLNFTSGVQSINTRYYMKFPQNRDTQTQFYGCSYVDLFWSYGTSSTNGNPKIFWKTCTGSAGFINITNRYGTTTPVVSSPPPPPPPPPNPNFPPPPPSPGGGGGTITFCCFAPGTLITMADMTYKLIEDVKVGDLVLSFDFETGENIANGVRKILSPIRSDIYEYKLSDGTSLKATVEHPLYVINKGWTSSDPAMTKMVYDLDAEVIEIGDVFLTSDKKGLVVEDIIRMEIETVTYTFSTVNEEAMNYYANGVLSHNVYATLQCEI
jgi:hypothetical protein